MFFMMGIQQAQKELNFDQTVVCPACGRFGHLHVTMTYTYLSLFFLPILKWGKRFYASISCCGAGCELDPSLGRSIARGEIDVLDPVTLQFTGGRNVRHCRGCDYTTEEEFEYCPKCGTQF